METKNNPAKQSHDTGYRMNSNQRKYIEYVRDYSQTTRTHIWLGGSFLHGNPTPFSDVDISAYTGLDALKTFIYG